MSPSLFPYCCLPLANHLPSSVITCAWSSKCHCPCRHKCFHQDVPKQIKTVLLYVTSVGGDQPLNNCKLPYLLHNIATKTLSIDGNLLCNILTPINEFCPDHARCFSFGSTQLSACQPWEREVQATKRSQTWTGPAGGDIQAALAISRHQLV